LLFATTTIALKFTGFVSQKKKRLLIYFEKKEHGDTRA
jgi:hypothetical protein